MITNDLINEYASFIRNIAKKFYHVEKEDLYQAGYVGLIKAYNKYDKQYGEFNNFAYKYIYGEMYDLFLKSRNIKINKDIYKLYKLINKTRNLLSLKYFREISNQELSEYLNISLDQIEYVLYCLNENVDIEYANNIGINEDNFNKVLINDSIDNLDSLSSQVIKYRYYHDYSQSEVGAILGINQVKVSRIEKNAKKKILEYIS